LAGISFVFKRATAFGCVLVLLFLAGCRLAPIQNYRNVPIHRYDGKTLTLEEVRQAIYMGGAEYGWSMQTPAPGHVLGTLNLRGHTAVVDITYTSSEYSITYHSSENLMADQQPGEIHRNYNNWVKNLKQAIDAALQQVKATSPSP
jgi:hypothetical protein